MNGLEARQSGSDEHGARTEEHAARSAAAGLVLTETSHTPTSEIIELSSAEMRVKGMKGAVLTAGRLLQEAIEKSNHRYRAAMLTLTYADIDAWRPKHISQLTNCIREYLRRRGHKLFGVWVAELQQRGAVHYHLVLWLPKGLTLPKPDKRGWWPHGFTEIAWARKPVGYLVKYASKTEATHKFPPGCRIHGALGLSKAQAMERRWWRFPKYIRQRFPDWQLNVARAVGGGIVARETGEWVPALYILVGFTAHGARLRVNMAPEWLEFFARQQRL